MGKPDINDAIFIIPTTTISVLILLNLNLQITTANLLLYLLLVVNGILISLALHIVVLAATIFFIEADNIIMLYRDLGKLGRFPASIYGQPLRFILYFIIPIGFMITIPSEILFNATPTYPIFITLMVGIGSLLLSLKIWQRSLKSYSSASS